MEAVTLQGSNKHLLVFFHGTGGDEQSLMFLRELLDPAASVLSFRGDWTDADGQGRRFFKPLVEGELEYTDFETRLHSFLEDWNALDLSGYTDISLIGFSNGANFIIGLLQRGIPQVRQAILLHPAALDYGLPQHVFTKPILITVGEKDRLVQKQELLELCRYWQDHSFPLLQVLETDGGHSLTVQEKLQVQSWYQKNLID